MISAPWYCRPGLTARPDLNGAKTSAGLVCDWLKDRGADGRSDPDNTKER